MSVPINKEKSTTHNAKKFNLENCIISVVYKHPKIFTDLDNISLLSVTPSNGTVEFEENVDCWRSSTVL
jgi:hypothetical protein